MIEVHFFRLHWEMKGHWLSVNFVKREALLKDLHTTSVLSFPNANDQKCTSILICMLKRLKTLKSRNNQFQFFRHVTVVYHWKIFATVFLCFIAGECHGNVNILT